MMYCKTKTVGFIIPSLTKDDTVKRYNCMLENNGRRDRRCVNNSLTLLDFYAVEKRFNNSRSR